MYEDMRFNLQHPHKNPRAGTGDRRMPRAHRASNLAPWMRYRFNKRPCPQNERERAIKERHPVSASGLHTHVNSWAHVHTPTSQYTDHIYTNLFYHKKDNFK